jgi:hypothetical protein
MNKTTRKSKGLNMKIKNASKITNFINFGHTVFKPCHFDNIKRYCVFGFNQIFGKPYNILYNLVKG